MPPSLQVDRVQFFATHPIRNGDGSDAYPDCDGAVWYLQLEACGDDPRCEIACAAHPAQHHSYYMQPFARDGPKHRVGSSPEEQKQDRANIWGWDGDKVAPSVMPSFLVPGYKEGDRVLIGGQVSIMSFRARVHLFLRAGRIELCSDSQVVVAPDPVPCREV